MNVYDHYLKSADKEAAERLEQAYKNMVKNGKKDAKKGQAKDLPLLFVGCC
ncbi:MAG: hypothetical protein RJR37_10720 [Peptococcaceae bacterium MAG4]|nr:hypothetical protein [Peptococcaceae bacterium MAG4]